MDKHIRENGPGLAEKVGKRCRQGKPVGKGVYPNVEQLQHDFSQRTGHKNRYVDVNQLDVYVPSFKCLL